MEDDETIRNVARVGGRANCTQGFGELIEGKRPLEDLGVKGRII